MSETEARNKYFTLKHLNSTHETLRISLVSVITGYLRSLPAYATPFMLTKGDIWVSLFKNSPKCHLNLLKRANPKNKEFHLPSITPDILSPAIREGLGWGTAWLEQTENARLGRTPPSLAHPKLHLSAARKRKAPGIPRKWSRPYRRTFLTSSKPPFPWGIITHSHPDMLPKRLLKRKAQIHTKRNTLLEEGSSGSACAEKPGDHARPSGHGDCTDGAGGGPRNWKPGARGSSPTPDGRRPGAPALRAGSPARRRCLCEGSGPGRSDKVDQRFPPSQLRPPGRIPEEPDSRDAEQGAGQTEQRGAAAAGRSSELAPRPLRARPRGATGAGSRQPPRHR